ncbi:phage tail protein [Rudanella paleaurantiibacter]|uniref:Phage tail protein n=1 Tax=Rudanella paleaurantiibacter TaxID=2614655 RepID=A0A7J5TZ98_9BACT|nr:tail fiber protein [Rudanella paleaurantiibacter]KAB7730395.1 phage tail protein [Rudanella paleaurantiibacter]
MPYIGEIRLFAGSFPPVGWAFCDGQLIPIAENDALFILIGTTYGGDGQETFALPDLRGRVPMHMGTRNGVTYTIGEQGGRTEVVLSLNNIPPHTHPYTYQPIASSSAGISGSPQGNYYAGSGRKAFYRSPTANTANMANIGNNTAIQTGPNQDGGNLPVNIMQPYLTVSFIISLYGQYPQQS